jgi:nanoRNase/pAp phosphatase (c-di-AMP/oligoRNAs hydrolase)
MEKLKNKTIHIINELINLNEDILLIQPHNFPDHDAISSAFGLQQLLKLMNVKSYIIYDKEIQRDSLKKMIKDLNIQLIKSDDFELEKTHKIILVDGCKGNSNVTDLIGDEVAVIDHHEVTKPDDVKYSDIRQVGACATIITSYYEEFNFEIPKDVATALIIGINMDTFLLTRGVKKDDLNAYFKLYEIADIKYVNSILRNSIKFGDFIFYQYLIDNLDRDDKLAFCYFEYGCEKNLLGLLSDFILSLEEIEFVVLCANNFDKINFSVRSENSKWNASLIIQSLLKGIGFGGGHSDLAGGVINNINNFNKTMIFDLIIKLLK